MEANKSWYAMRDLKRANAKERGFNILQNENIEVFTPFKVEAIFKGGKKRVESVPIIPDLLFVHSSFDALKPILDKTPTLQHRYQRGKAYKEPMIVSDSDMERFIYAVTQTEHPHYFMPEELTPEMYGKKIRIIGGILDSYEGRLLKCRGSKKKHVIVEIPGILITTVEVKPEFIELI